MRVRVEPNWEVASPLKGKVEKKQAGKNKKRCPKGRRRKPRRTKRKKVKERAKCHRALESDKH